MLSISKDRSKNSQAIVKITKNKPKSKPKPASAPATIPVQQPLQQQPLDQDPQQADGQRCQQQHQPVVQAQIFQPHPGQKSTHHVQRPMGEIDDVEHAENHCQTQRQHRVERAVHQTQQQLPEQGRQGNAEKVSHLFSVGSIQLTVTRNEGRRSEFGLGDAPHSASRHDGLLVNG